jgi:hypothetical protein
MYALILCDLTISTDHHPGSFCGAIIALNEINMRVQSNSVLVMHTST